MQATWMEIIFFDSLTAYLLAGGIVLLALLQVAWLGSFVLDLFFDTSQSTAAERARHIGRFVAYGVLLQITMLALVILLVWREKAL